MFWKREPSWKSACSCLRRSGQSSWTSGRTLPKTLSRERTKYTNSPKQKPLIGWQNKRINVQYEYVFEVEFLKGQPLFDVDALAIVTCKLAWVWPQNKNIENIRGWRYQLSTLFMKNYFFLPLEQVVSLIGFTRDWPRPEKNIAKIAKLP